MRYAGDPTRTPETQADLFLTESERVLRKLQGTLGEVLDGLPTQPDRPQLIVDALKIDQKLAWRVANTVQCNDPFAAAQYIPGKSAYKKFLLAARSAGAAVPLIDHAEAAFADYEDLIRVHAGDRASLEMMLTACAKEDNSTADLSHRRMAFRGLSYIWGAQARTQLKTTIVAPSEDPSLVDFAVIHGFYKLRQLRPNAPLTVMRRHFCDSNGRLPTETQPIDPGAPPDYGIHLLEHYCSKPLPELRSVESVPQIRHSELISAGIGDTAAMTFVEGDYIRSAAPRYRDENNPYGANHASVCVPTENLIVDFLIREDAYGQLDMKASVYGNNLLVPAFGLNQTRNLLDLRESVEHLGRGPSVLHSPDVPRYPSMARDVFQKLGWDGDRFDVYRCHIEYPVVPCSVAIWFELPKSPHKDSVPRGMRM